MFTLALTPARFPTGEISQKNSRIEPVNRWENMETGRMPVLRFMGRDFAPPF